jgi:hypothetical protein
MSINKFSSLVKESSEEENEELSVRKIYLILIKKIDNDDNQIIDEDKIVCFDKYLDAADYLIKWVNNKYNTDFDEMKEDGNRLFVTVDRNPDYIKAKEKANGIIKIKTMEVK